MWPVQPSMPPHDRSPCLPIASTRASARCGTPPIQSAGRVVPFPSATTPLLLAYLAQWCSMPRALGGFQDLQHRLGCEEVLAAMLQSCAGSAIAIFVDDRYMAHWPASGSGECELQLEVTDHCMVDISRLAAKVDQSPRGIDPSWKKCLDLSSPCSLLGFLRSSCEHAKRRCSLFKQLLM